MSTMVAERKYTDSEIHRKAIDELKWDTLVDETDVGVQVDDGVVTLTGTVGSYAEKQAALNAMHRVIGVLDVANDLVVKVPGDNARSDTDIAQAVRRAIEWDPFLPGDLIRTTVANGFVTLEGTVRTMVQRDLAERAVRHLTGVRGVTNQLRVIPMHADPIEVRQSIESALERQAAREAERIQVQLTDGRLTLAGHVHSWAEKRAALGAAGHAPGVTAVTDHLTVDPYA